MPAQRGLHFEMWWSVQPLVRSYMAAEIALDIGYHDRFQLQNTSWNITMNDQQPSEPQHVAGQPAPVTAPAKKSSSLKLLLPLLGILAVVAGVTFYTKQQAISRQDANADLLKGLGVIAVRDSSRKYVETVSVPPTISDDKISEVFQAVSKMNWVKSFTASGAGVGDAEMEFVSGMKKLKSLSLAETGVTDAGVANIAGLTSIESLNLRGTAITEAALDSIAQSSAIKVLDISETRVSGDLGKLNGLATLSWLLINDLQINDDSMKDLAGNPALSRLTMEGLEADEASIAALAKARPEIGLERRTGTQ